MDRRFSKSIASRVARLERAVPVPEPSSADAQRLQARINALIANDIADLRELRDLCRAAKSRGFAHSQDDPQNGGRIAEIYQLADELVASQFNRKTDEN